MYVGGLSVCKTETSGASIVASDRGGIGHARARRWELAKFQIKACRIIVP